MFTFDNLLELLREIGFYPNGCDYCGQDNYDWILQETEKRHGKVYVEFMKGLLIWDNDKWYWLKGENWADVARYYYEYFYEPKKEYLLLG